MEIKKILTLLSKGHISIEEAYESLKDLPYKKIKGGICIDSHREIRTGHKEVIFGKGKSIEQLRDIVLSYKDKEILITKIDKEKGVKLSEYIKEGVFFEIPQIFTTKKGISIQPPWKEEGDVIILTAGSSDIPIGLEAYVCAKYFDLNVGFISDVGVAGIHRVFPYLEALKKAKILIVIAGMEGALPSVISGLTGKPILAVPTSIGYGTSFKGITALFGMLNSCSGGISVLNIDNGFGAALMAAKIVNSFLRRL